MIRGLPLSGKAGSWRATWNKVDRAAPILAIAASSLLFFWPVLFGRIVLPVDLIFQLDPVWQDVAPPGFDRAANPLLSDQVYQLYPWRVEVAAALRANELPIWNPLALAGHPFIANDQSSIFAPFAWVADLSPAYGTNIAVIAKLAVAALGMYALLRWWRASRPASLIAAFAFAYSGFSIVWLGYPVTSVSVWLPLILLTLDRVTVAPTPRRVALAALVIGAQFLGGHAETSFPALVIAGLWSVFRLAQVWTGKAAAVVEPIQLAWHGRRAGIRHAFALAGAGVLGFAVGAVQVLPFVDALRDAPIAADRYGAGGAHLLSLDFLRTLPTLILLIFPNILGNPTQTSYWPVLGNYNEIALYVGVLPLALALLAARVWWQDSLVRFWLFAAFGALGLALKLPAIDLLNHAPVFSLVSNGRWRLVAGLAIGVLAARGFDWVAGMAPGDRRLRQLSTLAAAVALSLLIAIIAVHGALVLLRDRVLAYGHAYVAEHVTGQPGFPQPVEYYVAKVGDFHNTLLGVTSPVGVGGLPAMILAIAALVLWLRRVAIVGPVGLALAFNVLVVVDLWLVGGQYNPTVAPANVYPATPVVDFLVSHAGTGRVAGLGFALMPNSAAVYGLRDIRGYEPMEPVPIRDLWQAVDDRLPFGNYRLLADHIPWLDDLLGVRYIVAEIDRRGKVETLPIVFQSGKVAVRENQTALPLAWLVPAASVLASPRDVLTAIRTGQPDLRRTVLLSSDAGTVPAATGLVNPEGRVETVGATMNTLALEVFAPGGGYLTVNQVYDPGWKATIAGSPAPVLRANFIQQAVPIPPGPGVQNVRLEYRPASFTFGIAVTGIGLVVTVVLLGSISLTRRRS